MLQFTLRRLFETFLLLVLLSLGVFALFSLIPGDFLSEMQLNPSMSPGTIDQLRQDYGIDRPFYVQYLLWLKQLLSGNFGYSFAQQRPAFDLIAERFSNTLLITLLAFAIIMLLALPVGVYSALRAGGWQDHLLGALSLFLFSVPTVVWALLILMAAFHGGWFTSAFSETAEYFLPVVTLALPGAALVARVLRRQLLETLALPFMKALAAKGLSRRRVLTHAVRHALNPVISLTGSIFAALLSGAVVVEKIFSWPGIGALTVDSIFARDLYIVLNCVLLVGLLTVAANFLADVALAWNDPRIRY
ncbi:MAG: ABC transporter permease [Acidobacteria bacterium]|nr:ABC transporter permease [Acidobacteriota bacterium]